MLAWYQWATPPAAAMRPTGVVPMQYFLCDRKVVAFTVDDIIPATPVQTSTIALLVQMTMRKSLPDVIMSPGRLFVYSERTAQFGYGVQTPF